MRSSDDGVLPEDPQLHACVVAYASDMTLLDAVFLPHGFQWDSPGAQVASLDHDLQLYTLTAPRVGRLGRLQVVVGQTLPVGTVVAEIVDIT